VVAIERLDQDGLRDLAGHTDRLGVVSVYVNADPRQDPTLQAVAIDLRNRYRELERRVADDADPARGRERTAALERLWPQVESLASPREPGRGRIAFAALGSDWLLRVESAMPVASRVVLDDGPFVHPLLELLDEGRTAGVVIVSAEDAHLLEWRHGSLESVTRMEPPYVEASHERTGEIGGGPEGQFHTPMREQRQSRDRDRTERFLDEVTHAVVELAGERGWERILVSGGERRTEPTVQRFPHSVHDKVFSDARVLSGLDDATLATTVTELVREQHADRETRLVERVREAGGSGTAALGLSEVATALNEGRVDHLLYDPAVRYVGSVGADGALFAGEEVAPGQPARQEPRLTERLVERALNTGARISPVEGTAQGSLKDAGGVAALLRW
jgi:peptide subunit release factor 1 (eRF1)